MNTNYENELYDVSINDLLPQVFKQWRKVLLIGIMIAVLFGLIRFIPLYNMANDGYLNSTDVTEKELLQKSVNKIQAEVNQKEKELEESVYYNLEPSMITKGFVSYYIDVPIGSEALANQSNLVSLYIAYFNSGELYNKIANQLSESIKPGYLQQIVKIESKAPSSFNINVIGANKKQTDEIIQLLKKEMENKEPEFSKLVIEHKINLIAENTIVVSDPKVLEDQNFQSTRLAALITQLDEKNSQLQNIEPLPITTINALLSGLKFAIIGFFAGLALALIYYSVVYVLLNKIVSRKQIINNCNLFVIGEVTQGNKQNRKLDNFIRKLAGEPYNLSKAEMNLIIANNILATSKPVKILIVGSKDVANTEEIYDGISSCEILKDYEISYSDKHLHCSETLANVLNSDAIIIIVKKNKSSLNELKNAVYTIENYKKDIIGVILA